ncbi:M20 metallopeptidase family protein [Actinomadura alba]|uniref:Amidohydrolase n=1 Tax=Actinomadura alba TaxID=406431 RepID=A0ABR7LZG9_9ACTN|nr:M20 family metallopeptidase [Actinomadura alba]MBC6469768.1 amidohydrolase [Actinomadura alba]
MGSSLGDAGQAGSAPRRTRDAWIEKFRAAIADELPAAVALRHRLHADPRVSGDEHDTANAVVHALDAGDGTAVAGTGRIVRIGGEGPPVVLRAELDALPIIEQTEVDWAARSGVMHACGHDVHMAGLVAVCRAAARIGIAVPILALLQPREETAPSGAEDVVASGVLDDAPAVIGAHVQPRLAHGVVSATPGSVNAAADEFEITIAGHGGHGGYPHVTRDPVLALCQVVVSLQQVASRRFDPVLGAVCSVGQVTAGSAPNVIPRTATARGNIRVMRNQDRAVAADLIREIVTHTAAAHGCEGDVRIHPLQPVLHNDPALAGRAARWLTDLGAAADTGFRSYGSDDFSHYCEMSRGLMMFVGTAEDTSPDSPGLHHARFLPDDALVGQVAGAYLAGYLAAVEDG